MDKKTTPKTNAAALFNVLLRVARPSSEPEFAPCGKMMIPVLFSSGAIAGDCRPPLGKMSRPEGSGHFKELKARHFAIPLLKSRFNCI